MMVVTLVMVVVTKMVVVAMVEVGGNGGERWGT